ncbi:hypothetical protein [Clostridium botulinum]
MIGGYQVDNWDIRLYNYCLGASYKDVPQTDELIKLTEKEYYEEKAIIEKANKDYADGKLKEPTIDDRVEKIENDITVLQNSLVEQQYNELMKGVK